MIYLASPYSHPDPVVVKTRVLLTMQCCAALLRSGVHAWSPILHSHSMAEREELPTDAAWWWEWSKDFIRRSDGILVLKIPGWDESKGVKAEADFARELNIHRGFVNEFGEEVL